MRLGRGFANSTGIKIGVFAIRLRNLVERLNVFFSTSHMSAPCKVLLAILWKVPYTQTAPFNLVGFVHVTH